MALNPRGTFGETRPDPDTPLIPLPPNPSAEFIRAVGGQLPMGYFNSQWLRGIGSAISLAGNVAAAVLPEIYLKRAESSSHPAAAAAGPTAHPVLEAARVPKMSPPTGLMGKIESVLDPPFLGGPSHAAHPGRYAPAGTKGYHMIKRGPHAGLWTRNRHRNVANIHALRRSLSRIHGFEKICRKVVHFVHPKRAVGHAVFHKRRKRA